MAWSLTAIANDAVTAIEAEVRGARLEHPVNYVDWEWRSVTFDPERDVVEMGVRALADDVRRLGLRVFSVDAFRCGGPAIDCAVVERNGIAVRATEERRVDRTFVRLDVMGRIEAN